VQYIHRLTQNKILTQKKHSSPILKAQLKLHRSNILICPVIINIRAPTYKIAKHVARLLNEHLTLNNHYLVSISTNRANDLVILRLNKNHKLITHNTKHLCINIPIEETLDITKSLLVLKNNDLQKTDLSIAPTLYAISPNLK